MYVKWKKRPMTRTNRHCGRYCIGAHALSAGLVESRRVNGKPRQLYLAYLGTIEVWDDPRYGDIAIGTGGRAKWPAVVMFWQRVCRQLETVRATCDRQVIQSMIAKNVPRLHVPSSSVTKITSHMPSRKCQYIAV